MSILFIQKFLTVPVENKLFNSGVPYVQPTVTVYPIIPTTSLLANSIEEVTELDEFEM